MAQPTDRVAHVVAVAVENAGAHVVRVEARLGSGEPSLTLTGLPDTAAWTTRDRVYAALRNSGFAELTDPIELRVFPDLAASDTGLDVAYALGVLAVTGQIPTGVLSQFVCVAELGLDGRLRPATRIEERLTAAARAAVPRAVVPDSQLTDAVRAPGITVHAARTLRDLVEGLRDEQPLLTPAAWPTAPWLPGLDLTDLPSRDHHPLARILEVAATGGHHVLLVGRATGATMGAERLPRLLPDLDPTTTAEVTAIHQLGGQLPTSAPTLPRPPWQAPHHTDTLPTLIGSITRPGAVSLAHGGILFLHDAAEHSDRAIEALRHVLDRRHVTLAGHGRTANYPARFQLIAHTNGCPRPEDCTSDCTPAVHRRYLGRLRLLHDRIDIHQSLPPLPAPKDSSPGEPSALVAARVAHARATAATRWAGQPVPTNAHVSRDALTASLTAIPRRHLRPVSAQVETRAISQRSADRVFRLAWTLADLAGRATPDESDVTGALALHRGPVTP